jgi:hypothetical protein
VSLVADSWQVIIMVNCSSPNLSQLLASPSFDEFFNGTKAASTVVHRVPTSVWQDKSYQSWMQRFGDSTQVGALNLECADM